LLNAIESNHLIFTGLEELEKQLALVFWLEKSINQVDDPTEDFAFNVFELDAASNNSVDDIRT
jgi:DNA polymerase-3 subunit gamma/tau